MHSPGPKLVTGQLQKIAESLWGLRLPLPFALNHINLWLLEDDDGWTLIDTGINTARVRDLWNQLLAGPLSQRPLHRILVTHFHPDHLGLAGWLQARTGAEVLMSAEESRLARHLYGLGDEERRQLQGPHYQRLGLDPERIDELTADGNPYRASIERLPKPVTPIADADFIQAGGRHWQVQVGQGHSPAHLCLVDRTGPWLIAGDQILPRISPNVSLTQFSTDPDPLASFLASLERLGTLAEDTRVLPAHGSIFRGLRTRVAQLEAHHRERLKCLEQACRKPLSVLETLPWLFERDFNQHELFFALGEALAHLEYLRRQKVVDSYRDDRGIQRYYLIQ